MPNVTLGGYNTVAITAASGVYRLSFNGGSSRSIDLMNLGGGAIFIRGRRDEPHGETTRTPYRSRPTGQPTG